MYTSWASAINSAFQNIFYGVIGFIPNLIVAIIIFIIGWLIGLGIGRLVEQIINSLRVDQALRSVGFERVLNRAGFKLSSGKFLGAIVKWFFIIVFLVAALGVLHLNAVNSFLIQVVQYLPHVIVAVLILFAAAIIANFIEKLVVGSAKAAYISSSVFLGKVARYAIWIFAVLIALDQLDVATAFVQTLFTGVVIAAAIAFGLAFGLGGQESAARFLERFHRHE